MKRNFSTEHPEPIPHDCTLNNCTHENNTPRRSHLPRAVSKKQFPVRPACAARLLSLLIGLKRKSATMNLETTGGSHRRQRRERRQEVFPNRLPRRFLRFLL